MNVLVVDDDKLNLKIAESYLKEFFPNYLIHICQQPELVMDILKTGTVDIILLDIMMPRISGIEVLSEIRQNSQYKDIQILMFTSVTDDDSFRSCFELGANDYLKKPINPITFKARITAASNTRKNLLELHELYQKTKTQNQDLQKMNTQMKEMQFFLIQSEKLAAIGELAAGVAHEINNPIAFVGSNLDSIANYLVKMRTCIRMMMEAIDPSNEELYNLMMECYKKNKLEFILSDIDGLISDSRDGIERVTEIVKSLRSFAHAGMENEMNYNAIFEMIDQVLLIVRNEAKHVVEIEMQNDEIPDVYCNRSQVGQVFLNILINAIQAIKHQGRPEFGKIWIHVYQDKKYACVSIRDNGPGIPEQNLSKIFNPFFTTKEVGQGTGLGLSISYDIVVNKHHGILDVKSKIDSGTEFIVKLPFGKNET